MKVIHLKMLDTIKNFLHVKSSLENSNTLQECNILQNGNTFRKSNILRYISKDSKLKTIKDVKMVIHFKM